MHFHIKQYLEMAKVFIPVKTPNSSFHQSDISKKIGGNEASE